MNARLVYLTIALFGSTAAPASRAVSASDATPLAQDATPPCGPGIHMKNVARSSRCFELRRYTLEPGNSADVLHARFRDRTMALFKRHGMTVIGFWQPVTRPDQLVYMLAFRDAAARDSAWAAFNVDPDWLETHAEMHATVDVENTFMVATDYSPMK